MGAGTIEIRDFPGGRRTPGARSAGCASVIFRGQIQTLGTNPVPLPAA
jgi:hypothetical protein